MILLRLWQSIAEPRHLKIAFLLAYLVTIYIGLVTLLFPPWPVVGELGVWLTGAMASFLVIAGLIGSVTVLPGWWESERIGIYSAFVGLTIYAFVAITLQLTETHGPLLAIALQDSDTQGSRLTQIGVIVLAIILFTTRLLLIRKHDFEPRG